MKNYRIIRIAPLHYDTPMLKLYAQNTELRFKPYAEQQKILFEMAYVYSDSFSRRMRELGHDACEIVYDLEILQKKWAAEKGIKYDPDNWQNDIMLKQIEDIKPDVIYFQDIWSLPYSIRKNLKDIFPFIRLIVIFRGFPGITPPDLLQQLANADVLLVGSPILLEKCKDAGIRSHLVYHSFDEAILEKLGDEPAEHNPKYDFTFAGSSGYDTTSGHQSRYWTLVELIQKTKLEPWIHDLKDTKISKKIKLRNSIKKLLAYCDTATLEKIPTLMAGPAKLKKIASEIIEVRHYEADDGPRLPKNPLHEIFPRRCHKPVFGIDMYRILRQSKVTFNKHSDPAEDTVDNIRMFQAPGVGTCLLTDAGRNISDLFAEDQEVVTYSSVEECIEKVNYLLDHDNVRRQIARAGQKRTLKDHTIINRCRQVDEILQKML
ncbi:MAG: glycosyltransferase [Desulfobacterales bacterium]|nr:glycosyltransferase [Desulfobacterales bacterium]